MRRGCAHLQCRRHLQPRPPGNDTESGTWEITDGILTGTASDGGQPPDFEVTIDGDTLTLGAPDGTGRTETFNRCPA